MSDHYEVVLSLFLRDGTPPEVLAELRWHLGLAAERPAVRALGHDHRMLCPDPDSLLPGGEIAVLRRQLGIARSGLDEHGWGLHVRYRLLDDDLGEPWEIMKWLAPYVETEGYAGCYRDELDDKPVPFLFREGRPNG